MISHDRIIQIEDWLDGLLSDEARVIFEAELTVNPELVSEVRLHHAMRKAFREREVHAFRQTVDALLEEIQPAANLHKSQKGLMLRMGWTLAAAIILVLAAIWFFSEKVANLEQLYATAFNPPEQFGYGYMRRYSARDTAMNQVQQPWFALNEAWSKRRPDEALRLALEIAQNDTSASQRQIAYYAAGVMELSLNHPNNALNYLEKADSVYPYAKDITWYVALAHVQISLNNPSHRSKAKDSLKKVLDSPPSKYHHSLAAKLLRSLELQH